MSDLYLDVGNTRIHWGVREGEGWSDGYADLEHLPVVGQGRVLAASVTSNPAVKQSLLNQYGDQLIWLDQPNPDYPYFQHCYAQPERLGVDRWLAMIGARAHTQSDVIVVDAGTALTIDVLDANYQHLGGWITPGLALSKRSLFGDTDKVQPFANEKVAQNTELGRNTQQCVDAGIRRQMVALVESVRADYPEHPMYLCGGDAQWLLDTLSSHEHTDVKPHLIFEGMDLVCAGSF